MNRYSSLAMITALALVGCHKTTLKTPPEPSQPQLKWDIADETLQPKKVTLQPTSTTSDGDVTLPAIQYNIAKDFLNLASPVLADMTRYRVTLHAKNDATSGGIKRVAFTGGSVKYECNFASPGAGPKYFEQDLDPTSVEFDPKNGPVPTDPFFIYDLVFTDAKTPLTCPAKHILTNARYHLVGEASDFAGDKTRQELIVTMTGSKIP